MHLGLSVVIFGATAACSIWKASQLFAKANEAADQLLSEASKEKREQSLLLKTEFQDADIKAAFAVINHTHGVSAASRSTASALIQRIANGCGREAFYYQGSGSDHRAGRNYSRSYYWAKDLMAPASTAQPGPRDVLAMVDVDYYVDMPNMLLNEVRPYLLYSFVPSRASKSVGDFSYCFNENNEVVYTVSGGGRYQHRVWNWDGDSMRVTKKWFGITTAVVCYQIERRQVDADHQLILLVPLLETRNPLIAWIAERKLEARSLARFAPVTSGFVRFFVNKSDGLYVSTGKPNSYVESFIRASVDDAIACANNTTSGKITLPTVKSKMDDGGNVDKTYPGAEVLLEFHLSKVPTKEFVSLVDAVRRFQWIPKGAVPDADAKPGMVAFMQPLLHGGFVPDVCKGNEDRFVNKRMKEITCEELVMDKFMLQCINEFVEFLIPEEFKHSLNPVEIEEVYVRQNKPSQRAILVEAEHTRATNVTKQFMKKEAYGNVNDPRGISTINGVDKRDYSRFWYAFVDIVLKKQKWYAFGKTPREVAERVAEICERHARVYCKDFSRMDGRHSNILHYLEKVALLRAFNVHFHFALVEVMNKHHHLTARTTFGIAFKTAFHRLSGGADTSGGNTMDTAFCAYLAYRKMYMSPEEAWGMLGIYGGDDGFDGDVDPTIASKAAASVGQVLEVTCVEHQQPGVMFLARRYGPDVWYGDLNSCCDIRRQLSKFHLTVHLGGKVTKEQKLQEKSYAFSLTDANTPVIGPFVTKVLQLFPMVKDIPFENRLNLWGIEEDAEKQYPNQPADWMLDYVRESLDGFDFEKFDSWLAQATHGDLFKPPLFCDPVEVVVKSPGRVVVDGDIKVKDEPAEKTPKNKTGEASGKPKFRPRKPKAERTSRTRKTT